MKSQLRCKIANNFDADNQQCLMKRFSSDIVKHQNFVTKFFWDCTTNRMLYAVSVVIGQHGKLDSIFGRFTDEQHNHRHITSTNIMTKAYYKLEKTHQIKQTYFTSSTVRCEKNIGSSQTQPWNKNDRKSLGHNPSL